MPATHQFNTQFLEPNSGKIIRWLRDISGLSISAYWDGHKNFCQPNYKLTPALLLPNTMIYIIPQENLSVQTKKIAFKLFYLDICINIFIIL